VHPFDPAAAGEQTFALIATTCFPLLNLIVSSPELEREEEEQPYLLQGEAAETVRQREAEQNVDLEAAGSLTFLLFSLNQ
jgi:hypothetical protein